MAAVATQAPPALEGRHLSKHYGGLRAVDDVSFAVAEGEILGIVGPNGAGKTTLFDIVTGLSAATAGEVLLDGRTISDEPVHRRCRLGLARTFQQPTVAGSLTVRENMFLATTFRDSATGGDLGDDVAAAEHWLDFVGMRDKGGLEAGPLGVFDKKRLMLGTAIATGSRVLLLDEPFGGLNPGEIDTTMELIRRARDTGIAVVCIEHVMRALASLAQRVLVMHHGATFFEGTPEEMLADERVIEVYLGSQHRRRGAGP
jgi:branched-chain amino acid transport system ATP-binding protein